MIDAPSPALIRAARGMLDWSMIDLAKAAGLSVSTVKRMQDGPCSDGGALAAVQRAFEAEGVRFLPDDGMGSGLRLKADVDRFCASGG